jgi:hypothetical protein
MKISTPANHTIYPIAGNKLEATVVAKLGDGVRDNEIIRKGPTALMNIPPSMKREHMIIRFVNIVISKPHPKRKPLLKIKLLYFAN